MSRAPARRLPAPKAHAGDGIAEHAPPLTGKDAAESLRAEVPPDWREALDADLHRPAFNLLAEFVAAERARGPVYPPVGQVFAALRATPLSEVRVVILGQDPYHQPGQAHGLAFSVPADARLPPSLRNLFKELVTDLGLPAAEVAGWRGDLTAWARQGVLLLNTVLTVRAGEAGSHRGQGWERLTDAILAAVCQRPGRGRHAAPPVFVLWGGPAQQKIPLLVELGVSREDIFFSAHPSPLSAHHGFFGSRPFSRISAALEQRGLPPIDWRLDAEAADAKARGAR